MTDQAELLPGTLDLLTLNAVSLGKLHGYGVLLRIGQISGVRCRSSRVRCTRRSIVSTSGLDHKRVGHVGEQRRAKYYRLTAAGRRRLGEETASWNRLVEAIARSLAITPQELG